MHTLTETAHGDAARTDLCPFPICENRRAVETTATPSPAIRVLHVINGEHYSGAERVQDLLAEYLPAEGFEVGFAAVKPRRFPAARRYVASPLFAVPMLGRFDLRAVNRVAGIIRDGNYALVHAHTPRSALIGRLAAWRTQRPFVYHVHSPAARDSTRPWHNWLNDRVERTCLRGANRLIAVSESLALHMRSRGYPEQAVCVVTNGVPAPTPVDRPAPRGEWTLGMVALFRPRKGTEILLEALARLRREGLPIKLRAVGPSETPAYEAELKRRVAALDLADAVHWTGYSADVNSELAHIDLFVLPSLFGEGLPMVVLEALAAGVPVVGTRVEGVPEAIRDGVDGVLAEPNDAQHLAQKIACIVRGELDWTSLRRNAVAGHARRFSAEAMSRGVAKIYRELLHVR